jgi:EAL domain-containing protein (putative c-di-GMP-specific phosphodiesterase class I)
MVTASMGVALSSSIYVQPDDLIRNAGMALDYARDQERVSIMLFDSRMHEHAQERQQIRQELPRAIEHNELCLHYQPIIDLHSGQLAGFEALLRWQHPERGLLSPGAFVPIAEESDLIIALGQWVLREVCRQARQWTEELHLTRILSIYINLSAKEFLDPRLIQNLQAVLTEGSLGVFQLKLEITESVMMDDADTTIDMLWSLRNLGFRLCIDDFGTGYSSLRYLQRFPVQTVKIDHSFISHFESDYESILIVKAIVLMAQALNMDMIAEWIETPEQLAQLEAMGCTYGQGHLFSRPIDAAAAEHWLTG